MKKTYYLLFLMITLSFLIMSYNKANKTNAHFKFEPGNYTISWQGTPFKTALTKIDDNTLTGRFCLNNTINNCEDLGPIKITRNENTLTFNFKDIVCRISPELAGEFTGIGHFIKDNTFQFIVNGKDCKRTYKNKKVILTKY